MSAELALEHDVTPAKLSLPRPRPGLVARPRLAHALRDALDSCRLVTLVAPAGSGKTVALSQMLQALPPGVAVGWISLDEDDTVARVLRCLTLALEPYDLPWRMSPQAMPEAADADLPGLLRVVDALALAMAQSERSGGVLVFDDVHRLAGTRVPLLLEHLAERLPPRWMLVLAGRVELPLPRARLRLLSELRELRKEDLHFREDEVQALLGLRLPGQEGQARDLMARTGGWPAGIALHLLDPGAGGRTPPQHGFELRRRLSTYITEEVVQPLPAELLAFLERSAVLDELTASRCAYVTGDTRAAHWLDEIDRRDLFVTVLDTEDTTLRLHDLFLQFLRARLAERRADELGALLQRAADTEPSLHRRVDYLLRAGRVDAAAASLRDGVIALRREGGDDQILRLIARFPAPAQAQSPDLALVRGLIALGQLRWGEAEAPLQRAMDGLSAASAPELALQAWALRCLALLNLRFADAEALWKAAPGPLTTALARTVDQVMRLQVSLRRGPITDTPLCLLQLAQVTQGLEPEHWVLGTLVRHVRSCVGRPGTDTAVRAMAAVLEAHMQSAGASDLRLHVHSLQSWIALWRGDVVEARRRAAQRDDELRWLGRLGPDGQPDRDADNDDIVALCDYLLGRYEEATALLRQRSARPSTRKPQLLASNLAQIAAAEHDWPSVEDALREATAAAAYQPGPPRVILNHCLRAEMALDQGRPQDALGLLQAAQALSVAGDMRRANVRLSVDLARVHLRLDEPAAASAALAPTLAHIAETGEVLGLMLCGPFALRELAAAGLPGLPARLRQALQQCLDQVMALRTGGAAAAAAAAGGQRQDAAADAVSVRAPAAYPSQDAAGGALSDRELQVVALLAAGQSNKVIARRLDLSPHTVKRHVARILDKTGQDSRGQAAAWLRARADLMARVRLVLPEPPPAPAGPAPASHPWRTSSC